MGATRAVSDAERRDSQNFAFAIQDSGPGIALAGGRTLEVLVNAFVTKVPACLTERFWRARLTGVWADRD